MLAHSPLQSLMNYATEAVFILLSVPPSLDFQFYICIFVCVCVCVCVWQEDGLCTVVIVCARMMCVLELVWQEE